MTNEPHSISPNGRYVLWIAPWEIRMSLWIESPSVREVSTDEPVFAFKDPHWSMNAAHWTEDDHLILTLRKYPGNMTPSECRVHIDCQQRTGHIEGQEPAPLGELEPALERLLSLGL